MSRYIDADALIDTFETKKAKAHDKSMKHLYGQNKNDKLYRKDCETESRCEYVLSVLRTTPTVDAVPIVRCKECKHNMDDFAWNGEPYKWCELQHQHMTDDFYCADGERRSDEQQSKG